MELFVTRNRRWGEWQGRLQVVLFVPCALLVFPLGAAAQAAQPASSQPHTAPAPDWVTAAGGHQKFDVISIHPEKNPDADSSVNVPFGGDDTYTETGGVFLARNWPVAGLISLAYKLSTSQRDVFRASLPDWAQSQGFNIEARTDNQHVTKDEMRLMVRDMLIERFGLKVHYETKDVSVYAVELIKPGVLGPGLRPHPDDGSCSGAAAAARPRPMQNDGGGEQPATPAAPPPPSAALLPSGFPIRCGTFVRLPGSQPYMRHEGGRDLTMAQITSTFTGMGNLGRPVVDRTDLYGTFDFVMEFIDERQGMNPPPDAEGLSFIGALQKQAGLKLVSTKAPYQFLIVDHIEEPTEN